MTGSFEELEVWKKSFRLSVRLYRLLKDCRDFSLRDQIQRSAISIPSNIAEGSERGSRADFQRFIRISRGSAAELRTQLYIAREIDLIPRTEATDLLQDVKSISRMLQALHDSLSTSPSETENRQPGTEN